MNVFQLVISLMYRFCRCRIPKVDQDYDRIEANCPTILMGIIKFTNELVVWPLLIGLRQIIKMCTLMIIVDDYCNRRFSKKFSFRIQHCWVNGHEADSPAMLASFCEKFSTLELSTSYWPVQAPHYTWPTFKFQLSVKDSLKALACGLFSKAARRFA